MLSKHQRRCRSARKPSKTVTNLSTVRIDTPQEESEHSLDEIGHFIRPQLDDLDEEDIKEDEDDVSNLMVQYCTILHDCEYNQSAQVFREVHNVIMHKNFDLNRFRATIPTIESCKRLFASSFEKKAIEDGFSKETVSYFDGSNNNSATLYYRNSIECLQKQLSMCSDNDIIFSDENSTTAEGTSSKHIRHPLHTDFFKKKHKDLKLQIMGSKDKDVLWYDDGVNKTFIGFIQVFTDKTVAALKANSFAAHAVHITFMNFTKEFRRKMIQEGHTVVGFLPVALEKSELEPASQIDNGQEFINYNLLQKIEAEESNNNTDHLHAEQTEKEETHQIQEESQHEVIQLEDSIPETSQSKGRHIKQELIFSSMKVILKPLLQASKRGFKCQTLDRQNLYCFPHLISYCCDIPEAKDMTAVRHNLSTNRPCHRCLATTTDLRNGTIRAPRSFRFTKYIRSTGTKDANVLKKNLKDFSIAPWRSFLEDIADDFPTFLGDDLYNIFTFEPLHNLHLGISKLLTSCTYQLVSSKYPATYSFGKKTIKSTLHAKKIPLLSACNTLLRCIEADSGLPDLHVDFSSKDASSRLNGIFLTTGVRGMLEGKDFRKLDTVFPFVASFVDTVTGSDSGAITNVHTQYTEIIRDLEMIDKTTGVTKVILGVLSSKIESFKRQTVQLFEPYVDTGLFTLKFHLLDHLVEDLSKFTSLDFLNAGPYEYYNTKIKQSYRKTSKRKATAMDETVKNINETISSQQQPESRPQNCPHSPINQELVKKGVQITLQELQRYASTDQTRKRSHISSEIEDAIPRSDIPVLIRSIREELRDLLERTMDYNIQVVLVKSGYISSFPTPTLDNFCPKRHIIRYSECPQSQCSKKRVFATSSFGSSHTRKHSNIFMKGESDDGHEIFWFAQTLLLFHIRCDSLKYHKQFAFVRFYECVQPKTVAERKLGCICLRWDTTEHIAHQSGSSISAGERYGVIPFESICGVAHVVRSNYAIPPFTDELPWPHHRFQVNRFYD